MESAEELQKIVVDLPESDWGSMGGESFWAKWLGGDLYELCNVPFYAYDLHFYDVVRAIPPAPDRVPEIREVVRHSGHKTLRVVFQAQTPPEGRSAILDELNRMLITGYEEGLNGLYAFDVAPEEDYQATCDRLHDWEQQGILYYETGMR